MSLKIIVLAKQVPDTRNVGKDAMTAEGTVNRSALPATRLKVGGTNKSNSLLRNLLHKYKTKLRQMITKIVSD